ncbi:hypothetical protein [Nonomuraea rhodomycinica]
MRRWACEPMRDGTELGSWRRRARRSPSRAPGCRSTR